MGSILSPLLWYHTGTVRLHRQRKHPPSLQLRRYICRPLPPRPYPSSTSTDINMRPANFLLPVLPLAPLTSAWGMLGHRTVALLSTRYLLPETAQWVRELLGTESIVAASTWADDFSHSRDGRTLHRGTGLTRRITHHTPAKSSTQEIARGTKAVLSPLSLIWYYSSFLIPLIPRG